MPYSTPKSEFFSRDLPELEGRLLNGKLIVIEGADGSGRSTQIRLLGRWLESKGYAVNQVGIKRSNLAAEQLTLAQEKNVMTYTTMALFYATDLYDQIVNQIIPALNASAIVLADRYVYTLIARAMVRGAKPDWIRNLYSPAISPDAIFYFKVAPDQLLERYLNKKRSLDYWESGMDLGLRKDGFDSFLEYQKLVDDEFEKMSGPHEFQTIDASRPVFAIQKELRKKIKAVLGEEE
jgi:dTMP kinase